MVGLKPTQNPVWDSNPPGWDSNQAKSLGIEPTWMGLKPSQNPHYLVSGANEAQVLDASSPE